MNKNQDELADDLKKVGVEHARQQWVSRNENHGPELTPDEVSAYASILGSAVLELFPGARLPIETYFDHRDQLERSVATEWSMKARNEDVCALERLLDAYRLSPHARFFADFAIHGMILSVAGAKPAPRKLLARYFYAAYDQLGPRWYERHQEQLLAVHEELVAAARKAQEERAAASLERALLIHEEVRRKVLSSVEDDDDWKMGSLSVRESKAAGQVDGCFRLGRGGRRGAASRGRGR